jgi:hypothetical protein
MQSITQQQKVKALVNLLFPSSRCMGISHIPAMSITFREKVMRGALLKRELHLDLNPFFKIEKQFIFQNVFIRRRYSTHD